jgi:diguanylate cyclase (GGDEF)-like protein
VTGPFNVGIRTPAFDSRKPDESSRRRRRLALVFGGALCVATALAIAFGRRAGPEIVYLLPPLAIVWSLCDILTAFLLFAQFYVSRRLRFGLLGAAYGFSGLLTWPYIGAYAAGIFNSGTHTLANQQIPASFYVLWHVLFPVLVMVAEALEVRGAGVIPRTRELAATTGLAAFVAVAAAGITAAIFAWRQHLPIFIINGVFQPAYWAIGMPLVITLSLAGCVALLADRRLGELRMWLALTLLSAALDAITNEASPIRWSYAWDVGKIMVVLTSSLVMTQMLGEIVRMYADVGSTITHRASRQAAARMRALWRIATSEGLIEADHVQMILDLAASNMRAGSAVFGVLSHVREELIQVDAVASFGDHARLRRSLETYAVGRSFAIANDVQEKILAVGRTTFWNDAAELGPLACVNAGWRSVIGSPIFAGGQSYVIMFGLIDPPEDEPFVESDVAFVEVMASNIGHRFFQREQFERLQFEIEHDSLTALYNRTQFQRLGHLAAADGSLFGVLLIDVDQLRTINERAGQTVGDALLVEAASLLRSVDERDLVARLGSDDFAVLLRVAGENETLASRVAAYTNVFARPLQSGNRDGKTVFRINASLGAAAVRPGDQPFETALACAAAALEATKENGGNTATLFGPELESVVLARLLERDELLAAMDNEGFTLAYQPTFDLQTRTITGAEALIRWRHPTRGMLAPDAFLRSVQRENLMGRMTTWVVRRIASDFKGVVLPDTFRCYFNVPAQVLESETFLLDIGQAIALNPGLIRSLGLEITESDVMSNVERAIDALKRVRRLGLLVAVDDFGTGHSSLGYLKRLPVDVVKLDKTFIDGLPRDKKDVALAELFLSLTKQMSLVSVGEGIETEEQAAWLSAHGCMIGQGYLFSKPVDRDRLLELLHLRGAPVMPLG